jgi:hypothetical protein
MTIRATSDRRFFLRFLLIGLVMAGFSLYCVYDGAIGYPNQRVRALKYQEFEEEGRVGEWPAFAKEQGWSTDPPGEPKTPVDFQLQYIMAAVTGAIALWFFSVVLRNRNRWIEAGAGGITSSWGQRFDWADVVALDKRLWKKKGIAKVYYQDGVRQRRFVIDDFKFLREPTGKILRTLESKIDSDKITGDLPEGAEEQAYDDYGQPDEQPTTLN